MLSRKRSLTENPDIEIFQKEMETKRKKKKKQKVKQRKKTERKKKFNRGPVTAK